MKILNITDISSNQKQLEILVEKEQFAKAMAISVKKNTPKANVPGFRKGKAPKIVIEKYYGKGYFLEDAFNECVPQAYEQALDETKLEVVSSPEYDIKDIAQVSEDADLVFTAKVYIKPACEIEGYKGLTVEATKHEVSDEHVNQEIETVRKQNGREIDITDRAAELGDIANIDYSGSVNGEKFNGGTDTGYDLTLGSGTFIPGFEDQVVGHNVGDEFDVVVTFPEDYQEETLAGKEAVFACKLNLLKKEELPEVDDEFVKDVSEFDTLDEYKASIKERLEKEAADSTKEEAKNNLAKKLGDLLKADIPYVMYENQLEDEVRRYESRLQSQGISPELFYRYTGQTQDDLKKQLMPQAQTNVKVRLALETVAKLENIEVSDEELEKEYADIAAGYQMEVDEVKKYLTPEVVSQDVKTRLALDLVYDNATIEYKVPSVETSEPSTETEEKASEEATQE